MAGGEGTLAEEERTGQGAGKKGRRPRAAVVSGVVLVCPSGQDEPAKQQPFDLCPISLFFPIIFGGDCYLDLLRSIYCCA